MKRLYTVVETRFGSWVAILGVDLGSWCIGIGWDLRPADFWVKVGPLYFDLSRDEPWPTDVAQIPDWTTRLGRWIFRKLEI